MVDSKLLKKYNFPEERAELSSRIWGGTGYPQPSYRGKIIVEAINLPIEESYFWTLDHLKYDWSFTHVDKITDVFAASEQSAFFGVSEQRLGLQQDKVAQYLKGISEMVKALFQIVREIRIIDERLSYYNDVSSKKANANSSEITLKGVWVDQVEGGVKNAASVYGLAQNVGFAILPDLFFRVRVDDPLKIDDVVDRLEFNEKVKEVLRRKLRQFYEWKKRTFAELETRRNFTIKYLRQHYDTIKLYMGWIKPYLRNIRRLQLDQKKMDSADMITAFEGAMVEIEVLVKKINPEKKKYYPCVLVNLLYRTRPAMNYMQEGYQRGPAHTGKFEMVIRGYAWSDEHCENYKRMKEEEDLELMSSINDSIKEAMDALGGDLKAYLLEAGEKFPENKPLEPEKKGPSLNPFVGIGSGFKELFGSLGVVPQRKKKDDKYGKHEKVDLDDERNKAAVELKKIIFETYKNYKKIHGMITW
ncbi:MAG: hypothetical protein GY861_15840 [bacterium]|nr:hypothetical protein [bacterium]